MKIFLRLLRKLARDYAWRIIVSSPEAHIFVLNLLRAEELQGVRHLNELLHHSVSDDIRREIFIHKTNDERHACIIEEMIRCLRGELDEIPLDCRQDYSLIERHPRPDHITGDKLSQLLATLIVFEEEDLASFNSYWSALKKNNALRRFLKIIMDEEMSHLELTYMKLKSRESARNIELLLRHYRILLKRVRSGVIMHILERLFLATGSAYFKIGIWLLKLFPQLV